MRVERITAALAALLLLSPLPASRSHAEDGPSGETLFYTNCATCHVGASGLMGLRPPPDLFRDPLAVGDGTAALSAVIRVGAGGGRMPAFAEGLDAAELGALVRFIRSRRQQQR